MNSRLRIIIPGGTGQVGSVLTRHFHAHGHQVVVLARKPVAAPWRFGCPLASREQFKVRLARVSYSV